MNTKKSERTAEWRSLREEESIDANADGRVTRLDNQFTNSENEFSEFIVIDKNSNDNNDKSGAKRSSSSRHKPLLLKDLDVMSRRGQVLKFGPQRRAHLIAQLTQDAYVLAAGHLMDYSKTKNKKTSKNKKIIFFSNLCRSLSWCC